MSLVTRSARERRIGEGQAPSSRQFLLNDALCVINADTGVQNNGFCPSFFDLFPAKLAVREEIAAYVRSFPSEILLTLCGRTPVLFVGTLAAHTGLVLAVVPEGEIKQTLAFPAAFHLVPACVRVSPSAQMRYKAHDEASFAEACRWLVRIGAPFTFLASEERELGATLSFFAEKLSQLLKVPLSADFSGLPALSCAGVELPFAVGVMLAVLVAAGSDDVGDGVQMYAAMEGTPTLHFRYQRAEIADTVPEFAPLLRCAATRGATLDVVCPDTDLRCVQIRACLGAVELSAQGVRERHRFLEGKSPLGEMPAPRAIPVEFSELSLD